MEQGEMITKIRKRELDREAAEVLGLKSNKVSLITEAFIKIIVQRLAEGDLVQVNGLGSLQIVRRAGRKVQGFKSVSFQGVHKTIEVDAKYYLKCKKDPVLTAAVKERLRQGTTKEKVMEKYGVDESADENLEKEAASGCPVCGKKPVRHGNVLMCPEHGSEPFEKKPV